ncbi:hypothetical protein [Bacillus paranthracis]|uniref:hypothetical protein n=1 Tax=Bacillus paranthracis TaxID=2026186 RepID=UPI002D794A2D|nr:hypothetical protein [Bacillus paranthracis]
MSQTHYKLPLDTEVDEDIIKWINKFHRNKKGEMVRHAIRYYMAILDEGEMIKFPSASGSKATVADNKDNTQQAKNRKERVKPTLNPNALK